MNEGKLKELILQGKIEGDYAKEIVDLSYVLSTLDSAKQDLLSARRFIELQQKVKKWFGE